MGLYCEHSKTSATETTNGVVTTSASRLRVFQLIDDELKFVREDKLSILLRGEAAGSYLYSLGSQY